MAEVATGTKPVIPIRSRPAITTGREAVKVRRVGCGRGIFIGSLDSHSVAGRRFTHPPPRVQPQRSARKVLSAATFTQKSRLTLHAPRFTPPASPFPLPPPPPPLPAPPPRSTLHAP